MTEAPEEKWLAHNGGLPSGNYPKTDLVRYIRADVHEAAVAAARKEGMLEAAKIADDKAEHLKRCDFKPGGFGPLGGWVGVATSIAKRIRERSSK